MGIIVGVVGRLSSEKNPGIFLRAAARVVELFGANASQKNVAFVWAGTGKLDKSMFAFARELGFINHFPTGHGLTNFSAGSHRTNSGNMLHHSICWPGFVTPLLMPTLMSAFDIFVLPSLTSSETFGIASLEA